MAPKSQKRSSNDFVVSDNDDDDDGPPKSKRVKAEKIGKASKADKAANTKGASAPKKGDAKAGASVAGGGKVNNEGEEYWEVSSLDLSWLWISRHGRCTVLARGRLGIRRERHAKGRPKRRAWDG